MFSPLSRPRDQAASDKKGWRKQLEYASEISKKYFKYNFWILSVRVTTLSASGMEKFVESTLLHWHFPVPDDIRNDNSFPLLCCCIAALLILLG